MTKILGIPGALETQPQRIKAANIRHVKALEEGGGSLYNAIIGIERIE
jgi:hypothetical protein